MLLVICGALIVGASWFWFLGTHPDFLHQRKNWRTFEVAERKLALNRIWSAIRRYEKTHEGTSAGVHCASNRR
jgi:hypothetical protein